MHQHVEFFDSLHFNNYYFRQKPPEPLHYFIDFVWQTRFEPLWERYPSGFSDALFPNIGYTFLINLGTPFIMQVGSKKFEMKSDGFLPRPQRIECFHRSGNRLFGIKFRMSPLLLRKRVNFSEYQGHIYPLSYLMEKDVLMAIKTAPDFESRCEVLLSHMLLQIGDDFRHHAAVHIVANALQEYGRQFPYDGKVENIADHYGVTSRTLQRYFEMTTGMSPKVAFQMLRIRHAIEAMSMAPDAFSPTRYGYFDISHFYKHLKAFLQDEEGAKAKPHLALMRRLNIKIGSAV